MTLDTSTNFIKDAVIDHVLRDIGIKLSDLRGLDKHDWDMFELLCIAKERSIRGAS